MIAIRTLRPFFYALSVHGLCFSIYTTTVFVSVRRVLEIESPKFMGNINPNFFERKRFFFSISDKLPISDGLTFRIYRHWAIENIEQKNGLQSLLKICQDFGYFCVIIYHQFLDTLYNFWSGKISFNM